MDIPVLHALLVKYGIHRQADAVAQLRQTGMDFHA
jgi:hypothetical protein